MSEKEKSRGVLHQCIAADGDLQKKEAALINEAKGLFTKELHKFDGFTKNTTPLDENRVELIAKEISKRETTVPAKLKYLFEQLSRSFDATVQKETTNTIAKARVIIGNVDMGELPVCAILNLETRFTRLRNEVLMHIPTLDSGKDWVQDPNDVDGAYKISEPVITNKTAKTKQVLELAPATEKHPRQVQVFETDEIVAKISTNLESGRMSSRDKHELLSRIDSVIEVLRDARMKANCTEVAETKSTDVLFNYILGK